LLRPVWIALLLALGGAAAQASGLQTLAPPEATSLSRMLSLPVMAVLVGGLFLGTLAISRFSLKLGVPTVLGVLLLGLFINTNVTLFSNETIAWLHSLSLSMLLFYAGLRTELRSIRGFLEYGVVLAVGGVIVSSLLLGLIVWFVSSPTAGGIELGFNQMPLAAALLIAACLGSTDAGATIGVLASLPKRLPPRLQALLEFESSVNDPAAILFLSVVVGIFTMAHGHGHGVGEGLLLEQLRMFLQKIGSGLVVGVILGYGARFSLEYLVYRQEELLILGVAIALLSYGVAELLEGSGFIAAYATGMFMSNHVYRNARVTPEALLQTLLPFNTMTEIVIFLIFGLAMHPRQMLDSMPEGIVIALGMMLIARPISVLLFQKLSPFSFKESLLIAWCGLRGAVPLALSFEVIKAIPNVKGIDQSLVPALVDNAEVIVFCVVVLNLLIQGLSLPHLCRALGIGETSTIGEQGEALS
jgi:cell volume regulation protein A